MVGAGHSFGNSGGPISAKLPAQLVNGETPEMDLAPYRFDRPSLEAAHGDKPLRY